MASRCGQITWCGGEKVGAFSKSSAFEPMMQGLDRPLCANSVLDAQDCIHGLPVILVGRPFRSHADRKEDESVGDYKRGHARIGSVRKNRKRPFAIVHCRK